MKVPLCNLSPEENPLNHGRLGDTRLPRPLAISIKNERRWRIKIAFMPDSGHCKAVLGGGDHESQIIRWCYCLFIDDEFFGLRF